MTVATAGRTEAAIFTSAPPGTRTPRPVEQSTAKQFIVVSLLVGGAFLSQTTSAAAAPTPVVPLLAPSRTLPAAPPVVPTPATSPSVADRLNRLRAVSSLNWGEISTALGVSRRAVHLWLNGGRVAGAHLARLAELELDVYRLEAGDPNHTRLRLHQAGPNGRSALEEFQLRASRPRAARVPGGGSVADLLGADETLGAPRPTGPSRRSTAHGGVIPPRSPKAS